MPPSARIAPQATPERLPVGSRYGMLLHDLLGWQTHNGWAAEQLLSATELSALLCRILAAQNIPIKLLGREWPRKQVSLAQVHPK